MTILKAGTPIGFQDKDGATLKVGDRIKNIHDASICVIDKFGKAVSPLGFKYDPASLNVSRGMQEDGNYFARLTDYILTDEPAPAKPQGETVSPGDDAQNMAPASILDPMTGRKLKRTRKAKDDAEATAVQNGCTPDEARMKLALQDAQDEDLADELRDRGYTGTITKTKTIII